jgi:hypothetical protein
MRNPVQEYNIARSMPIQALAAVLQGKSDMVSLGVAHAALKEKMEAEVAKKGASAMQMAQAPKIKDKDLAMAQGLGASPADIDVPMGGIVGGEGTFGTGAAGGGSVVAFQPGGSVYKQPTATPTFGGMMQRQAASAPGFIERGLGALRNMPYAGKAFRLASSPMAATAQLGLTSPDLNVGEQEYLDLIRKLQSLGYSAETIEAMSPDQRVAAATRGEQLPAGPVDTGGVPTQTLAQMEAAQAAPTEGAAAPEGGLADIAAAKKERDTASDPFAMLNKAQAVVSSVMGPDVESAKNENPEEFMTGIMGAMKKAGVDFGMMKDQMAELAKEKEEIKGGKKEAANLRLLEAGLGILGGESPYAFVNIGKGATPALKGFAEDIKDIQKQSRIIDKETRELARMQNQMALGTAKFGMESYERKQDRVARAQEAKARNEAQLLGTVLGGEYQLKASQISAAREGDISREISQMPGKTRMEQVKNFYKASTRATNPAEAAYIKTLETYATEDPGGRKLERLKESNPALYARIKQDLATYGLSTGMLTEKPDGSIRN